MRSPGRLTSHVWRPASLCTLDPVAVHGPWRPGVAGHGGPPANLGNKHRGRQQLPDETDADTHGGGCPEYTTYTAASHALGLRFWTSRASLAIPLRYGGHIGTLRSLVPTITPRA